MLRSLPLQILLLLTCNATAVYAKEPNSVLGYGAMSCKAYLNFFQEPAMKESAGDVFAWVQGYFSARNTLGDHPVTVGGSLSANTLESMLRDHCGEVRETPVVLAAAMLYAKLEAKGL
jgi:hypothetical protein